MQEQLVAVQSMQDYINKHLEDTITLADLSKVSLFSPWHSHRLFKEYTGYTPAEYIRRIRLSKSALKLRDEGVSVTDMAFSLGFQSIEGYQRAFRREFGCNPIEYVRHPVPIYLFIPYGVMYNEIRKTHIRKDEVRNIFVQIIHKPERDVLIKRGTKAKDYFQYCEEVGCDIWGLLLSIHSMSGEPVCMWLPEELQKEGTSEYVQGVEVSLEYHEEIPDGMERIHLPEADYMMFQGEPFAEKDYCDAIEGVQEAIKKFDPSTRGYEWDISNPRIQLEPIGSRGYIELIAVKALTK